MTFTPGINLCQFALGNKSALSRLGFDQQIPRDGRHNSGYSKREKDPPPAPGYRNPHRQRRHNNRRKHGRRDVNAGCRGFLFWWKPVIYTIDGVFGAFTLAAISLFIIYEFVKKPKELVK